MSDEDGERHGSLDATVEEVADAVCSMLTDESCTWAERVLLAFFVLHNGHHKASALSDALGVSKREAEANLRRLVREDRVQVTVEPDYDSQRFIKAYGLGVSNVAEPMAGTIPEE